MIVMSRASLLCMGFVLTIATPVFAQTATPGPSYYGYLQRIHDISQGGTTPVDVPLTVGTVPILESASHTTGLVNVTVTSQSTVTPLGLPLTVSRVEATSSGAGIASGVASASINYQVVVSGPGNPGDPVAVSIATFGSQVHTSPCTACLPTSLSSAAYLRVSAGGTDYFLLGDELVGNGSPTLFFNGIGTQPITAIKTLMLPLDTPINVNFSTTASGETRGQLGNPGLQPPDDISVTALLDPSFTPIDPQYTVVVSSNLVPSVPALDSTGRFVLVLLLTGCALLSIRRFTFNGA